MKSKLLVSLVLSFVVSMTSLGSSPFDAAVDSCVWDVLTFTSYDPDATTGSYADLYGKLLKIEEAFENAKNKARSTNQRVTLVRAEAWIAAAKTVIEKRKPAAERPKPKGFILGYSRLGQATLADEVPPFQFDAFVPSLIPLDPKEYPTSKDFGEDLVASFVKAYFERGEAGLKAEVEKFKEAYLNVGSGFDEIAYKVAELTLKSQFPDLTSRLIDKDIIKRELAAARVKQVKNLDALAAKIVSKFRTVRPTNPQPNLLDYYLLQKNVEIVPFEAFHPTVYSLPKEMAADVEAFRESNPYADLKTSLGREPTTQETLVEMMNDSRLREILAVRANAHVREQGKSDQEILDSGLPLKKDILFIGAGVHETHGQAYLSQNRIPLSVATVEREEVLASTFAVGDLAFNLNSSSRAENPAALRQRLGDGDLNFSPGGIIQMSQFSTQKNPPARYWAQTISVNRGINSAGPVFFGQDAATVEMDSPDPAYPYVTRTKKGGIILSRAVIQTGIGSESFPPIENLYKLYRDERNLTQFPLDAFKKRVVAGEFPLKIEDAIQGGKLTYRALVYRDMMRLIKGTSRPMSLFSDATIAIIGPGDSAKALVRWFIGEASPESYGRDTSRTRLPKKILWYGQTCNTCDEFVSQNRSFYADLSGGFRSERIKPKNRLANLELSPEGKLLLEAQAGGSLASRAESEVADIIINVTGFESQLLQIYGDFISLDKPQVFDPRRFNNESPNFRIVQGYEPSLGRVGIARQLVDKNNMPQDIYFVGPLAGNNIVDAVELKQIGENAVANANHNWRVWLFMEALSRKLLAEKRDR